MTKDFLWKYPSSHGIEYLSAAVDLFHLSNDTRTHAYLSGNRSQRFAIASIIQAFIGLEALINSIGYEFLLDRNNPKHLAESRLNVPLENFRRSWEKSVSLIDKIRFVFSQYQSELPASLEAELRELIIYRNWVVHGFIFTTELLVEQVADDVFVEHDRQDTVDWKTKFPHLKFSSLDRINSRDAEKALRVNFGCIHFLAKVSRRPYEILYFKTGNAHIYTEDGTADVEELISGTSREWKEKIHNV